MRLRLWAQRLLTQDASILQITAVSHVIVVRIVQQRFGWNAANVQACSTQCRILLDTYCFHAQLSSFYGSYVSTRTRANDHDICVYATRVSSLGYREPGSRGPYYIFHTTRLRKQKNIETFLI